MAFAHKNKTFATLLAFVFGGAGLHRFYLYGKTDTWGWLHFASLPLSLLLLQTADATPAMFSTLPAILSILVGFIEALVIGLTSDEQWDARHNAGSAVTSASGWPLAVLLVLITGAGAVAAIGTIARAFDLLYTGGSFG
jgi:hypothetical protein